MHNNIHEMWRKLTGFFVHLDAKMYRAVGASVVVLALVVLTLLVSRSEWGQATLLSLENWMAGYRNSPLAVLIVILVFCVSALFGAPQFILVAACVLVFGPVWGGLYSWAATVVSAAMTFYMGRLMGQGLLNKFGGNHVGKLSNYIGKNAFSASFIIRNLPTAPPIVVNMAFGATKAPFLAFLAGCALGSIPKILLVAILGGSLAAFRGPDGWKTGVLLAVLAFVWLGVMLGARRLYLAGKDRG